MAGHQNFEFEGRRLKFEPRHVPWLHTSPGNNATSLFPVQSFVRVVWLQLKLDHRPTAWGPFLFRTVSHRFLTDKSTVAVRTVSHRFFDRQVDDGLPAEWLVTRTLNLKAEGENSSRAKCLGLTLSQATIHIHIHIHIYTHTHTHIHTHTHPSIHPSIHTHTYIHT